MLSFCVTLLGRADESPLDRSEGSYEATYVDQNITMNITLNQIYATRKVIDVEGNVVNPFPTGMTQIQGQAIYDVMRERNAQRSLEVGMAHGLSTLFMCQALKDNGSTQKHVAMDPGQLDVFKSSGLTSVRREGLEDYLEFYPLPSAEALPKLLAQGERFDVIFIDGMHLFDFALVDFFYADQLLTDNGIILLDDTWMPCVNKLLRYILRNRAYRLQRVIEEPYRGANFVRFFRNLPQWRTEIGVVGRYILQNPLDWNYLFSAFRLALGGSLSVVGLEKLANDTRDWTFHKPF